ncbi:MAG TPA: ABC transporter permease [Geminicoccaceae bacterium]|nr:ABC transporter permease [Geminicoccaceae bacterium]
MSALVRRYGLPLTGLMAMAAAAWVLLLIVLPYFLMVDYSFRPNLLPAEIGGPRDHYTLENYATLFKSTVHFQIFWRSIWGTALITVICLAVCYPIAFYLAQVAPAARVPFLLLLLVIPFWINEILRTFAWFIILAYQGPLNALLLALGVIERPVRWLSGSAGVLVGMVYAFILFMMLPLYNALESLDRDQLEAARDLGAGTLRIHRRIVIPHAKPGIAVGCIMVFMLAVSSYAVPAILGSPGTRWFTEIIYQWFFEGQNWPQGSAYAFILLVLCLGFILLMMRLFKVGLADIAK